MRAPGKTPYGQPHDIRATGNYTIELRFESTMERDEVIAVLREEAKKKQK